MIIIASLGLLILKGMITFIDRNGRLWTGQNCSYLTGDSIILFYPGMNAGKDIRSTISDSKS